MISTVKLSDFIDNAFLFWWCGLLVYDAVKKVLLSTDKDVSDPLIDGDNSK
jgi:hypothetical protein